MSAARLARLRSLLQLAALGALVGLACWPLNRIDILQDRLLASLPAFRAGGWSVSAVLLALAPIPLLPLLLWCLRGPLGRGGGSGIPQVLLCLEEPRRGGRLLSLRSNLERLGLWTAASLALLPLGREGPVVALGAAVAQGLLVRWPRLLRLARHRDLLAGAAGAGLAGGFNTPLLGMLFVAEELTRRFHRRLVWPALVMASGAALVSNLGGQPLFALGINPLPVLELEQILWAIPIGLGAGLCGGLFARLLVQATALLTPLARRQPLRVGLAAGVGLSLLALATGGASGGDGELLLRTILDAGGLGAGVGEGVGDGLIGQAGSGLALLAARLLGPLLALSTGIPGGLIDPAFALGGVFGAGFARTLAGDPHLGMALGMAAGLAATTQLPVTSIALASRMLGDQQVLPGLVTAAIVAACVGRMVQPAPVYHALTERLREQDADLGGGAGDSSRSSGGSEGAAAVIEDEDHGRTGQGDQGQRAEVGDQMKVDAHGASAEEGEDRHGV